MLYINGQNGWGYDGSIKNVDDIFNWAKTNNINTINYPNDKLPNFQRNDILIHLDRQWIDINQQLKLIDFCNSKNTKAVLWITDVDFLRFNIKPDPFINLYNKYDLLITHNDLMNNKLKLMGVKTSMIPFYIHDYHVKNYKIVKKEYKPVLHYAGNLSFNKCKNLIDISKDIIINLYGAYFKETWDSIPSNLKYKGKFKEDKLPEQFQNGFGVVWDNEMYGEYQQYNNPLKFSLYIASELPVIAKSNSAMAKIINKYNIGITVDSLKNVDKCIKSISTEDYKVMLNNLKPLGEKVRNSYFTKNIIKKVLQYFKAGENK